MTFTFVTDGLESAIAQAKSAAQDRDVTIIGGARVAQQALNASLVDELQIDIMPVLLRKVVRLFDHLDEQSTQMEKIKMIDAPLRTHLAFRIMK